MRKIKKSKLIITEEDRVPTLINIPESLYLAMEESVKKKEAMTKTKWIIEAIQMRLKDEEKTR